jgi:hypothetical protein
MTPIAPLRPGPAAGGPASGRQDWLREQAAPAGCPRRGTWARCARPATGPPAIIAHGRPLLVACRNTAAAAAAATAAVAALTRPGARVAALVIVSDGWTQPPAATARFRLLAPHVGAVIHIPFVPALRLADGPAGVPPSAQSACAG